MLDVNLLVPKGPWLRRPTKALNEGGPPVRRQKATEASDAKVHMMNMNNTDEHRLRNLISRQLPYGRIKCLKTRATRPKPSGGHTL